MNLKPESCSRQSRNVLLGSCLLMLTMLAGCAIGEQRRALDAAPLEIARVQALMSYEETPDDSNWGRLFGSGRLPGTYYVHELAFADGSQRRFELKAQFFAQDTCLSVKRSKQCVADCKPGMNLTILSAVPCPADFPQAKSATRN